MTKRQHVVALYTYRRILSPKICFSSSDRVLVGDLLIVPLYLHITTTSLHGTESSSRNWWSLSPSTNLPVPFHVMRRINAVFLTTSYLEPDKSSSHPHTISYFFVIYVTSERPVTLPYDYGRWVTQKNGILQENIWALFRSSRSFISSSSNSPWWTRYLLLKSFGALKYIRPAENYFNYSLLFTLSTARFSRL
jgi:hypothetical protein